MSSATATMDIFLAASEFGESFGMVIAEAMTAGIPVVTISTPHTDNAQIELVDNRKTGLVVERNIETITNALTYLYENEQARARLSAASKLKIKRTYNASEIVKSLENLIYTHLNLPLQNGDKTLLEEYSSTIVAEYDYRCLNLWKPAYRYKN